MKLSELVARCEGDPELMIEDENGVPCAVAAVDHGLTINAEGAIPYVLLEPQREAWHDEDEDPNRAEWYQLGEDFIVECAACGYRERGLDGPGAAWAAADAHRCAPAEALT